MHVRVFFFFVQKTPLLCVRVRVCMHVCVCACRIYSQRRLIPPAGPVRLFLGALSSQLEATAVTCLPNIAPLLTFFFSLLHFPQFLLLTVTSLRKKMIYLSSRDTLNFLFFLWDKTSELKDNGSFIDGSKISLKRLQSQMIAVGC